MKKGYRTPLCSILLIILMSSVRAIKPNQYFINPEILLGYWDTSLTDLSSYSSQDSVIQERLNNKHTSVYTYVPTNGDFVQKHLLTAQDIYDSILITPQTHKWVVIEMMKKNGSVSKIELLRPNRWVQSMQANKIGCTLYLKIPELGLEGNGRVVEILPCQLDTRLWKEQRQGDYILMPITAKFEHLGSVDAYFFDDSIEIRATPAHKFWNSTNQKWLPIGEWRLGDEGYSGNSRDHTPKLINVLTQGGYVPVYNLEVNQYHNYQVTDHLVLVHNNNYTEEELTNIKELLVQLEKAPLPGNGYSLPSEVRNKLQEMANKEARILWYHNMMRDGFPEEFAQGLAFNGRSSLHDFDIVIQEEVVVAFNRMKEINLSKGRAIVTDDVDTYTSQLEAAAKSVEYSKFGVEPHQFLAHYRWTKGLPPK